MKSGLSQSVHGGKYDDIICVFFFLRFTGKNIL